MSDRYNRFNPDAGLYALEVNRESKIKGVDKLFKQCQEARRMMVRMSHKVMHGKECDGKKVDYVLDTIPQVVALLDEAMPDFD